MNGATLVLIHGFWSSAATWDKIADGIAQDGQLRSVRIHRFAYESPKLHLPFLTTRIPDYNDIAQSLASEYSVQLREESNVVFVTHSQGGLILQRFLAWMLNEGRGEELTRIRQVIMLACPNDGSEYLRSIRAAAGFGRHPQGHELKVLNEDAAVSRRIVLRQVVNADGVGEHKCRIPIHVYAGRTDKIVNRTSAQSAFPYTGVLPGNHSSILDPDSPNNITIPVLKRDLLYILPPPVGGRDQFTSSEGLSQATTADRYAAPRRPIRSEPRRATYQPILGAGAVVVTVAAVATTLIGRSPDASSAAPITLTVGTFGDSFDQDLFSEYTRRHPGIVVKEARSGFANYSERVHGQLVQGSGAADLVVMDSTYLATHGNAEAELVDLRAAGVSTSGWAPDVLGQVSSTDGRALLGLPLDVGGLTMCYRKSLLTDAGIPADRESVAAMFSTWKSYLDAGRTFRRQGAAGVAWFDAGVHLLNGILGTEPQPLRMSGRTLTDDSLRRVKAAWDQAAAAAQGRGSAHAYSDAELQQKIKAKKFVTLTCPSWMLGRIKKLAGGNSSDWDVVPVPGGGQGNWGGTFLSIPKQSSHPNEAVALAEWLLAPEQQARTFTRYGVYPATTTPLPAVRGAIDSYFGSAPVGALIGDSVKHLSSSQLSNLNGLVANACGPALRSVEDGADADRAWARAIASINRSLAG